ncbi:MAG: hypothetical protein ACI9MC_003635 [Kiritimatiellia bacterium]|jgi:hypothetical protein
MSFTSLSIVGRRRQGSSLQWSPNTSAPKDTRGSGAPRSVALATDSRFVRSAPLCVPETPLRCVEQADLVLAIAVGEGGEAEEGEPVRTRLVERVEEVWLVFGACAAGEQLVSFVPTIPAEVGVEQLDDGP